VNDLLRIAEATVVVLALSMLYGIELELASEV